MPWKCDCGDDTLDDAKTCPVCGMSKEEWSVKFDSTRNFVVPINRRKKRNTWVEVQAFDAEGAPLEEEPYWIRLANGRIRKEKLDPKGYARLENVPVGECQIRFPRFYVHDFGEHEEDETPRDEPKDPATHRLDLELLDEEGVGVAGASYWVKLPDRDEPVTGKLDARGRAGLITREPGACEIRFPELYAHDVTLETSEIQLSGQPKRDGQNPSDWVEIELLDERGRPRAGQAYQVRVPGRKEPLRGTLDGKGRARVPATEQGPCEIEFVGLYAHDVERLQS